MEPEKPASFWWLWLPLIVMAAQFVMEITVPPDIYDELLSENGPHELAQFITLVLAFFAGLKFLTESRGCGKPLLTAWLLLAVIGCFYVGGEEVSWGQHFLNWSTPESWKTINDQQETNLHNTSSWLDQKPRLFLELGVIVGGLLLPLYRRLKEKALPPWLEMIAPPSYLAVIAGSYLFAQFADKLGEATDIKIFRRSSEIEELYIFYFILLYLLHLGKKIKALKPALQGEG